MKNIVALHRHWYIADCIKRDIEALIPEFKEELTLDPQLPINPQIRTIARRFVQHYAMFTRLSVWYALLYVVIEGYRDVEQKDAAIEKLLAQSEMVDVLRRFRNAIFHYQEDPYPEKLLAFLKTKESEVWMRQLNAAFESYFERVSPIDELFTAMADINI